jgi:hypothetical protein
VAHVPSVVQAPPVLPGACQPVQHHTPMASYQTTDLWEEINRHRGGEDSRTTIKHNCERRRDIEGHNLERDFDLHALVGARQVAHAPLPLAPQEFGGGGGMALAPHLCMVVWPPKFQPHLPEKYDRTVNPTEFLQIYSTSVLTVGGNEAIMANYFPVALTGTARSWLMNLPEGTLHSWSELCRQFMANFESAYTRLGNLIGLHTIQEHPGESLRSFIRRFSQVRNTIPRLSNASIVVAFCQGVRDEKMLEKLTTHDVHDVSALFSWLTSVPRLRRVIPGTPQLPK